MSTLSHAKQVMGIRLVLSACLLWLLPPVALGEHPVEMAITDENVIDVVERELLFDQAVPSNRIDVTSVNGVVTLTGSVGNILAKQRAVRIAESVKGVRSVVNRIEVKPPLALSDEDIKKDVEAALRQDPATESYEVSVEVHDGSVLLTGSVDSWRERELSATVAKGVKGVTELRNDIDLTFATDHSDFEIKTDIEQTLRWDVLVDHALVNVAVEDGAVRLTGIVGSAAEKRQARHDAWTSGVTSVDASGLEVEGWARDERLRAEKYVSAPDDDIREAVEAALVEDPRVMSFNVSVSVLGGIVTLRGAVDNLKARRAAEQDARNTVGVSWANNFLKIRPLVPRSDEKIESEIEGAFLRDPCLDRHEIAVAVYGGTVYLKGSVQSNYEKAHADNLASRVSGVVGVVNGLNVVDEFYRYDPYIDDWDIYGYRWYDYQPRYTFKSDWRIKRDIENELWWSPFIDVDEVDVTVDDGVATLTGTVGSWMEKGAARDNAYQAGATYVRNELVVQ